MPDGTPKLVFFTSQEVKKGREGPFLAFRPEPCFCHQLTLPALVFAGEEFLYDYGEHSAEALAVSSGYGNSTLDVFRQVWSYICPRPFWGVPLAHFLVTFCHHSPIPTPRGHPCISGLTAISLGSKIATSQSLLHHDYHVGGKLGLKFIILNKHKVQMFLLNPQMKKVSQFWGNMGSFCPGFL